MTTYKISSELEKNTYFHMYWKDADNTYQGCNDTRAHALGMSSSKEIIGKVDADLYPAGILPIFERNDDTLKNTRSMQISEEPFIDAEKNEYLYLVHRFPMFNPSNDLTGIFYISFDISESKRIERANTLEKEQLEATLDSILTNLPGHVYWKDLNSVIIGCNDLQAHSAGLKNRKEMVGKTDYELPWKEDADLLRKSDLEVINSKKTLTFEETSQTVNSDHVNVFLSKKAPLYNKNGEIIGVLGISFDISDRKKMEEELHIAKEQADASNQAKTEFLANMRHDIRTPLSGIVGFSELSTEPRIKEYADNLVASNHALLDLMDEVLEAVKVSSGEIPRLNRKFDLKHTMDQVIALYQAHAYHKGLELSLSISSTLPHFVIGDKIRLHRIILELVGNALNFTEKGSVRIHVDLAKKENRQLIVKITVSDTGLGIPKEKQHDIYLQFKRLTPSYQGIYKGAGLGLFVAKQFIDELDGEIHVESEPLKGSYFTCLIPFKEPLMDDSSGVENEQDFINERSFITPITHQLTTSGSKKSQSSAFILVVEDNIIAQTVARALLTGLSCQVDIASNGIEALNLCKNNHYDLIFMDIGLGQGIDGYEVTHHIRNQEEMKNHIPIIALTAHAGEDNKQRCIESGMDAVITKPLTQTQATDILNNFIPARRIISIDPPTDLPDTDDELFRLNQFALLDHEQALKSCGNNQAMLLVMFSLMINEEVPPDLEKMKKAYAQNDYSSVEKIAHKIKGGAVYLGTTRMKYACQYLERYWKSGERELFDALYHQAIATIEETLTYIEGWLRKSQK